MQRCDKRGDDEMTQNDICSPPGALTGAPVAFHFFIKGERNCIHLGQNLTANKLLNVIGSSGKLCIPNNH